MTDVTNIPDTFDPHFDDYPAVPKMILGSRFTHRHVGRRQTLRWVEAGWYLTFTDCGSRFEISAIWLSKDRNSYVPFIGKRRDRLYCPWCLQHLLGAEGPTEVHFERFSWHDAQLYAGAETSPNPGRPKESR